MVERDGAFRGFCSARNGSVVQIAAIMLPVAVLCAALVIDTSILALEKKKIQSAADLAAIIAAGNMTTADAAAVSVLSANGISEKNDNDSAASENRAIFAPIVSVTRGRYSENGANVAARFMSGAQPPNAVKVTVTKAVPRRIYASLHSPPTIDVSAVARAQNLAMFSIGSRLVRIEGGALNALLGALLGSEVKLTALDYRSLMETDVDAFEFLDALAFRMSITAGSYDTVLSRKASLFDVAGALADIAFENNSGAIATPLARISRAADAKRLVDLSLLFDAGPFSNNEVGAGAGFPANVAVWNLIFASALIANGDHFLQFDVDAGLQGLGRLEIELAVGETMRHSPWIRIGEEGDSISNVQIRGRAEVSMGGNGVTALRVPLVFEIARAEATLREIRCRGRQVEGADVSLGVRPGLANIWIGDTDLKKQNAPEPAVVVKLPGASVRGFARVELADRTEHLVSFNDDDIARGAVKSVHMRDYASLVSSLSDELVLEASAVGRGLVSLKSVETGVEDAVGTVYPLLETLLSVLGARPGEADARVSGVQCGRAVLVQ